MAQNKLTVIVIEEDGALDVKIEQLGVSQQGVIASLAHLVAKLAPNKGTAVEVAGRINGEIITNYEKYNDAPTSEREVK